MIEEIKFIKTDKTGLELQNIKESYPNSIIDVNSKSEKNIYIGSERVTDNYNLCVDDSSITNNVGGMSSGINASELKGKSVSEILDIILFASNNDLTLKGVQVVDTINNLMDNTLEDVYQGMVVSVIEDNSLYILLTNSDSDFEREWKKVGSDVNIEELTTSTKKLSSPITVAGLTGSLGANISNGKIYTTDNTIEDILRDLLCKEIYPEVSLTTINPTISFSGLLFKDINNNVDDIASKYESIMEVGSVLNLNQVSLNTASISTCYRRGSGFSYGYSFTNDNNKNNDGDPPKKDGESSLVGLYTLTEIYEPSEIGNVRTSISSDNCENVKFDVGSIVINLGSNNIYLTATSPSGVYTHPEYPEYFIVSNLGNTNVDEKMSKSPAVNGTLNPINVVKSLSVTGVYPVYVNIESNNLVPELKKMPLTTNNIFEFNVPSEVASGIYFNFDYPATHYITSFEIKDLSGKYVNYDATYNAESEIIDKSIGGKVVQYKRLTTTGKFQGEGIYKITLSKGLDK